MCRNTCAAARGHVPLVCSGPLPENNMFLDVQRQRREAPAYSRAHKGSIDEIMYVGSSGAGKSGHTTPPHPAPPSPARRPKARRSPLLQDVLQIVCKDLGKRKTHLNSPGAFVYSLIYSQLSHLQPEYKLLFFTIF